MIIAKGYCVQEKDCPLQVLQDYQTLITEIDQVCHEIKRRYPEHISCKKGCPGNCCRRHISVFPIEAMMFARALQQRPAGLVVDIQHKARQSTSFGPCPLLENGACLMYEARAVICRTHGYPILSEYRGHRSIGFCHKNFKNIPTASIDRMIELAPLNERLTALNLQFLTEYTGRLPRKNRFTVGEALLLEC